MSEGIDYPDLPDGWSWWSGNRADSYYTRWFGTDEADDGYEGEVYWDEGGPGHHFVHIYPILGIRDDGDPDVSEYPDARGKYDTEQEAVNAVPELIAELDDD